MHIYIYIPIHMQFALLLFINISLLRLWISEGLTQAES